MKNKLKNFFFLEEFEDGTMPENEQQPVQQQQAPPQKAPKPQQPMAKQATVKPKVKQLQVKQGSRVQKPNIQAQHTPPKPQAARQPVANIQHAEQQMPQQQEQPKVVSLQAITSSIKGAKVVLVEPREYAEVLDIANNVKNRYAVIINLQNIDQRQGMRVIDFLTGTAHALGGEIRRIGDRIFLCTPENIEITGEISTLYIDEINE